MPGLAQAQAKPVLPKSLIGRVNGERLTLRIFPEGKDPITRKLKGTRFINIEPGCIMLEAYVKLIKENEIEINMPHDDVFTTNTMKLMGVISKRVVVSFEPSKATTESVVIVAITPIKTITSKRGGAGQTAIVPELKSEGKDKPQPESKAAPQ